MMRRRLPAAFILVLISIGCGANPGGNDGDDDDDTPGTDAAAVDAADEVVDAIDATTAYPDADIDFDGGTCNNWQCTNPIPDGCQLGTSDICGNGLDDNCNGFVDEGCACTPGAVQQCFVGPPGHRNVGGCVDGMQTCQGGGEFVEWGPCVGGIRPGEETCDSVDNDCNGCADDHPDCCVVELACPSSMPDGEPFQNYVINGATFYSGAVTSWTWTVTGGPCDQLLQSTAGTTTYTVTGQNTSTLTLRPTLSGDYTITVRIVAADGTVYMCTFIVHIRGPGLRIEQCSDRTAETDIDLHLHRPLNTGVSNSWFSGAGIDTCFYGNCKGSNTGAFTPVPNWGYANSPLAECAGGPEGASWQALGYCRNPRLDIDSINDSGVPENINVDVPQNNATYRVMVNFFSGGGTPAHPLVNIYCGGYLRGSYGLPGPMSQVNGFDFSGGDSSGDMWRVVDVTPMVNAGTTTDCMLAPLRKPCTGTGQGTCAAGLTCMNGGCIDATGATTAYWVETSPRTY